MRIAIVPSLIAPVVEGRCFGGAEIAALALAEALARRGHQVALVGIAGSGGRGLVSIEAPPTPAFVPGQQVSEDPGAFPAVLAALAGFDVVHTHLNDPGALVALDRFARSHPRVRVLSTLHLSAVFPATTRVVQRNIDAGSPIVWCAPSHFAARSYQRADAIRVVPNGVDPDALAWSRAVADDRVAWAGRRVPEKGLEVALQIAHRAGRVIEVAGPGAPVEALGVIDHGRLPRGEVHAMFARSAAVLVTSSIAEAHPLVAIEALLSGTPVVGFEVGGLPEIVDPECGVLVAPGDVAGAVRALAWVSELSRETCRTRAITRFSEARMVDDYLALYAY